MNDTPLLEVRNLRRRFRSPHGGEAVEAVDGVSFAISEGEVLGLVGESGSGKSTISRCILHLCRPDEGEILLRGDPISNPAFYRKNRAQICRSIQMIFQDAASSVNPRMTIGEIVAEPLSLYFPGKGLRWREERTAELLARVGLERQYLSRRPGECSGGQLQRVCIARALALEPKLLVADEPVSSLDVSMQAQILNLLLRLQREQKLACLFVAHDLSVVRHISDRIGVLYRGRLVELAPAGELYGDPRHPYTRSLLAAATGKLTPTPAFTVGECWTEITPGHFAALP